MFSFFQVCELHFEDIDFIKEAVAFDEKSGHILKANLKIRRLNAAAVPSIFENYPKGNCSETVKCVRQSPNKKRGERESEQFRQAIAENIEATTAYINERQVLNLSDICVCAEKFSLPSGWTLNYLKENELIYIFFVSFDGYPDIKYYLEINKDLAVTVSIQKTTINKIGSNIFPLKIHNFNQIVTIIDEVVEYGINIKLN